MNLVAQADAIVKSGDGSFTMWIIMGLGTVALLGALCRMRAGWGPENLRVVGLILVATLVSLLAIYDGDAAKSAFGILGAIAGYLFGASGRDRDAQ
jgi:peptidoglycan/LPS O-acetylase OafA/YrhL